MVKKGFKSYINLHFYDHLWGEICSIIVASRDKVCKWMLEKKCEPKIRR